MKKTRNAKGLSERANLDNPAQAKRSVGPTAPATQSRSVGVHHSPDILNCLANLSSDEVFTSPELANRMLDLLPQDLFSSPKTTFLDPCCKSGVFLREIAKRLLKGLEKEIPDLQKRIDHIMSKQLFGIALTRLTAEMGRRTLYCAKKADSEYSVATCFKDEQGHLRYMRCEHTWENGKCSRCGANRAQYDRVETIENYAYPFIHKNINEIFKNMQFDVIIGNPPYQMSKASENSTSSNSAFASAIYPLFIEQALKLKPQYLIMITPSRWMTKTGQGISNEWVDRMIGCNHFVEIHDFIDSTECFAGVDIMGGVNYFLYQGSFYGKCRFYTHNKGSVVLTNDYLDVYKAGVVIRNSQARAILNKVIEKEQDFYQKRTFSAMVGPSHFYDKDGILNTSWRDYSRNRDGVNCIKYYLNKKVEEKGYAWISEDVIPKNNHTILRHKVFIPKANGSFGEGAPILGVPFYGEPNSVCSQTYLYIGRFMLEEKDLTEDECMNIITYIKTKFFRYMVSIKKNTQDNPSSVFQFVPLQDFSHPWTDEMLYKKYGLDENEIDFIESMIKPME